MEVRAGNIYFKCSIKICDQDVAILSSDNHFHPDFGGDKDYKFDIPGWSVTDDYDPINPSILYKPDSSVDFSYDPINKRMSVTGSQEHFSNGQALAYLSYWLSEGERQRKRIFSMHSAAVAIDGRGVLLIGEKGAGKTTTMMDLSRRYDAELLANDLSIVAYPTADLVQIIEGSKRVRLRLGSVKTHFPELTDFFPDSRESLWETKVLIPPQQLGIRVRSKPTDLNEAFLVHLSPDPREPLKIKRMAGLPAFFELYENLSRIIRGSAVSIFGYDGNILGFIPSLETKETHQNKVALLNHLINDRGIWSVSGSNLEDITDVIYGQVIKN